MGERGKTKPHTRADEHRENIETAPAVGRSEKRSGARPEERGGCVVKRNATNFGEEVEPVVLDSLLPVALAPGVCPARATPSPARRTRSRLLVSPSQNCMGAA